MDYIEVNFVITPKNYFSDILIAKLADIGFNSFVETEKGFLAYIPQNNFSEKVIKDIFSDITPQVEISYSNKSIKSQNWNEQWEKSFDPVYITGKCCIRAPFHKIPENVLYDIIIEPKMSFGTGHHETTCLMVEQMLTIDFKNKLVLDVGCGTGILSILASKMKSPEINAVDIDEWSYLNTIENTKVNNIKNVLVHQGDIQIVNGKYNVILANINKNVLLRDLKKYCKLLASKGEILMSGFFESDISFISNEAIACGLVLKNQVMKKNWAVLHFSKAD